MIKNLFLPSLSADEAILVLFSFREEEVFTAIPGIIFNFSCFIAEEDNDVSHLFFKKFTFLLHYKVRWLLLILEIKFAESAITF